MGETITLLVMLFILITMFGKYFVPDIPVFNYIESRKNNPSTDDNNSVEEKISEEKSVVSQEKEYFNCQYCGQPSEKNTICNQCGANSGK